MKEVATDKRQTLPTRRRSVAVCLLLLCLFEAGTAQSQEMPVDNICHRGEGKDVSFTLQDSPDTEELHLTVNSDYFTPLLSPKPNSTRRGLLLRIDIEDFSPEGRSHIHGQNIADILITPVIELSRIAKRSYKVSSGYKGVDDVDLTGC